jgi:hypothetical protein
MRSSKAIAVLVGALLLWCGGPVRGGVARMILVEDFTSST